MATDKRRTVKVLMPDYAGLRQYRRARSTGHVIGVYDGEAADMDTFAGRWQTLCEDHGNVISHETLELARQHATQPEEWCDECGTEYREKHGEPNAD